MKGNPICSGSPLTSKPTWFGTCCVLDHVGFFHYAVEKELAMLTRIGTTVVVASVLVAGAICAGCSRGVYLAPAPRGDVYYDSGGDNGGGVYEQGGIYNGGGVYDGNSGYYSNGGRDRRDDRGEHARTEGGRGELGRQAAPAVGHVEQGRQAAPAAGRVEQGKQANPADGNEDRKDHK
jgi:hypothetical protein